MVPIGADSTGVPKKGVHCFSEQAPLPKPPWRAIPTLGGWLLVPPHGLNPPPRKKPVGGSTAVGAYLGRVNKIPCKTP